MQIREIVTEGMGRPYSLSDYQREVESPGVEKFITSFETDQGFKYLLAFHDHDIGYYSAVTANFYFINDDGKPISNDDDMRTHQPQAQSDPRVLSTIIQEVKRFVQQRNIEVIVVEGGSQRLSDLYRYVASRLGRNYEPHEISGKTTIFVRRGSGLDLDDVENNLVSHNVI